MESSEVLRARREYDLFISGAPSILSREDCASTGQVVGRIRYNPKTGEFDAEEVIPESRS